jgi:5,10-methylenetetrahydromethanopterin reductase
VSRRELAVAFQTDKTPERYAALARRAEHGGFDVVSVYHDLFFQPALAALLPMAEATERVRLGPAALNPFTLHPAEIAGQVAALDRASGGRAYLGLVKGAWLDELGLEQGRPLAGLREAVEVIGRLLRGDDSGFAGEVFRLAPGARLRYEPLRPQVPLLVGTWGPETTRWAGTVADEVKVGGSASAELVPVVRDRLVGASARLVMGAVCVVDEDGEAARRRAAAEVERYLPVVAALDPTVALPEGPLPPELLARFAFAGTPEEVAAQAEALFRAGADRVEFGTPHGLDEERGLELLCTRVLPLLRPG